MLCRLRPVCGTPLSSARVDIPVAVMDRVLLLSVKVSHDK